MFVCSKCGRTAGNDQSIIHAPGCSGGKAVDLDNLQLPGPSGAVHPAKAILKDKDGLKQLVRCPKCEYVVFDSHFDDDKKLCWDCAPDSAEERCIKHAAHNAECPGCLEEERDQLVNEIESTIKWMAERGCVEVTRDGNPAQRLSAMIGIRFTEREPLRDALEKLKAINKDLSTQLDASIAQEKKLVELNLVKRHRIEELEIQTDSEAEIKIQADQIVDEITRDAMCELMKIRLEEMKEGKLIQDYKVERTAKGVTLTTMPIVPAKHIEVDFVISDPDEDKN